MLPFEKPWYRKLLILAPVIGAAAAVLALIFMRITGTASDLFFGGTDTGWWAGRWWWIPLTAFGGLIVSVLRKAWNIPKVVPGSVALAQQAWVDPSQALYWVVITMVSLMTGASLGPSFGLVVLGGVVGSWLVTRMGIHDDEEAKQGYTLTGMAGGHGRWLQCPPVCRSSGFGTISDLKAQLCCCFHPRAFFLHNRFRHLLWRDRPLNAGKLQTSSL